MWRPTGYLYYNANNRFLSIGAKTIDLHEFILLTLSLLSFVYLKVQTDRETRRLTDSYRRQDKQRKRNVLTFFELSRLIEGTTEKVFKLLA